MKLWIDDIRESPEGWDWAKTSHEALTLMKERQYDEISFDHDLGGDDTTRPVVLWLCEEKMIHGRDRFPRVYHVHSANPVGRQWLTQMLDKYSKE